MTVRSALPQRLDPEHRLDTHPEIRLEFDQVQLAARQRYDRPFLLVDPNIIRTKARRFKAASRPEGSRRADATGGNGEAGSASRTGKCTLMPVGTGNGWTAWPRGGG